MNRRIHFLALVVCTTCGVSSGSHAKAPEGSDDFSADTLNTANWAVETPFGAGRLGLSDHHLSYTTLVDPANNIAPTTDKANVDFHALDWNRYNSSNGSWTYQIDVSMPSLSSKLVNGQFVQYGLQAVGLPFPLAVYVEEFKTGDVLSRQFHAITLEPPPDPLNPKALLVNAVSNIGEDPAENSALRFRFDGATQHLFAEVDRDTSNGHQWAPFADLANFDLTSSIAAFGESGLLADAATGVVGPTIVAGDQVFGDNVQAVSVQAVPEPSTYATLLAGLGMLAWLGFRAKGRSA